MTDKELAMQGVAIISAEEGSYTTVVANDNGAMAMGIFGFRGSNAGALLADIVASGGEAARWIVLNTQSGNTWADRPATDSETADLRQAIGTSIGRQCQDAMAATYVEGNIVRARKAGLRDERAILYYCDFANQYGPNSTRLRNITAEALKKGGDLDAMYQATLANTTSYLARRGRVYQKLLALSLTQKSKDNTPDAWAKTEIDWAIENGILRGDTNGDLLLHSACTRQDCAVLCYRVCKLLENGGN